MPSRRSPTNRLARVALGIATAVVMVGPANAQSNSGASDLLLPIGARAVGLATTGTAMATGDGVWGNPAGIAWLTKPEFAIDHFSTFAVPGGDAISLVIPAGVVGVFGLSARQFSYCSGDECASTDGTGQVTGTANLRSILVGASFAATFGSRFSAGISARVYQYSDDCTGVCNGAFGVTTAPATTGVVDMGLQYRPSQTSPFQFGAAVSNWGPRLQVNNQSQADALPTRLHVGATWTPTNPAWDPALRVRLTSEFIATPSLGAEQEEHIGAELGYVSGVTMLTVRGGFVQQTGASSSSAAGPRVGFGITSGRLQLDLARVFDALSSSLGSPPTYISIRVGL